MKDKAKQIFLGVVLVTAAMFVGSTIANGEEPPNRGQEPPDRSLVGVWEVKITPRDCTTGDPIPSAALEALFTFHNDGTMAASFRNTPGLERTAAHGLWRRDLGWSDYSFKFVHLRRQISTGLSAGKQESGGTLVLSESGDEYATDAHTIVFNADGIPVASSCSNSVGTRFKLEP